MDILKKKFITISKKDIENIKNLIIAYGATYYDAPNEADELCAMLAIKNKVWACLSEDMDMFIYGCPRIIRYFSLLNHTVVIYDLKGILKNLGITLKELREICVLSGTDYNYIVYEKTVENNMNYKNDDNVCSLLNTLKYFKKYHKSKSTQDFYDWMMEANNNYIKDYEVLKKIYNIFDLSKNHYNIKIFENIKIMNGPINKNELNNILKQDGFLLY
jgi:hypothetical protein